MTTISPVEVSFERILVPTDFTDASTRAMEYAKAIARKVGAEILLLHVDQPLHSASTPELAWAEQAEILQREGRQLEQAGAALRSECYRARALSLTGSLNEELLSAVERHHIDLIVLGAHGKGGLERLLLGSDAEGVLRCTPCPVLSVGPRVPDSKLSAWSPREVICATTLDARSAGAAAFAYMLARQCGAQIVFFHVEGPGQHQEVDWTAFDSAFRGLLPEVKTTSMLRVWATDADVSASIVDLAKRRGSDLIVMGVRTASSMMIHLVRGIAPKVPADAPCPVLTIEHG